MFRQLVVRAVVVLIPAVAACLSVPPAAAQPRQEVVRFAAGASSARVTGTLRGDADIDYLVRVRAGQTLKVVLTSKNASAYMNVLPPGSDEALFIGSVSGGTFEGPVPSDGDYRVRVYLMRSAARRGATAAFTLDVAVTGGANPASQSGGTTMAAFDKTLELQGIRFRVTTASGAGGTTRVVVTPSGLTADNAVMERPIEGRVSGAEVGDLNADGSPELYVYVVGPDLDARGTLVAFSANRKRSLSDITLPPLDDTPAHAAGYRGHDEFSVLEGRLGRRFPIYSGNGAAATPSGRMRQIQYRLVAGEATWVLRIDRVTEF